MSYKQKYMKYKQKYITLKNEIVGGHPTDLVANTFEKGVFNLSVQGFDSLINNTNAANPNYKVYAWGDISTKNISKNREEIDELIKNGYTSVTDYIGKNKEGIRVTIVVLKKIQ